jgi:hypothetical protein
MKSLVKCVLLLLLLQDRSTAQTRTTGPISGTSTQRAETYQSAVIDANGSLLITTSDTRTITVPKEGQQSSFEQPILSPDRTAVGAQANYPNCCSSYDIPLQLLVYAYGKAHRFTGIGLAIFRWHFADADTRIAFGEEEVHSACRIHYELRDIQSERLIEAADVPEPCGQIPNPPAVQVPKWVSELNAAQK